MTHRSWIAAAILVGAVGACGPLCGNGKLNFANAHVDPAAYTCPPGASDYRYDIKTAVDADNQTSNQVTIKSVATVATVTKLAGNWGVSVGAKTTAENLAFSPKSIASGAKATLKVTLPWSCTNGVTDRTQTYADFALVMTVVTSAGTYKVDLPSHRMTMATG